MTALARPIMGPDGAIASATADTTDGDHSRVLLGVELSDPGLAVALLDM